MRSHSLTAGHRLRPAEPQWAALVVDLSLLALLSLIAMAPGCAANGNDAGRTASSQTSIASPLQAR
jgi:hypothetical protein